MMLFMIEVQPTLITHVVEVQCINEKSEAYSIRVLSEHGLDRWTISEDGGLRFQGCLYVPALI